MIIICGIAGIYFRDFPENKHSNLENFCNTLLINLNHRGGDATGIACYSPTQMMFDKDATGALEFTKIRANLPHNPTSILLHTRKETKGSADNYLNNHPVLAGDCFVVHNGLIYNDDELYKEFKYERKGQVDSEILASILNDVSWDEKSLVPMFEKVDGSFALASFDPVKNPGKVLLIRGNRSPLIYVDTGDFVVWASEKLAMQRAWKSLGKAPADHLFTTMSEGNMVLFDGKETTPITFTPHKTPQDDSFYRSYFKFYDNQKMLEASKTYIPKTNQNKTLPAYPAIPNALLSQITATKIRETMLARTYHIARVFVQGNSRQGIPYRMCFTCNRLIDDDDFVMQGTTRRCIDCAMAARSLCSEAQDKEYPNIRLEDFEEWASYEHTIHLETINSIAEQLNITPPTVESLMRLGTLLKNSPWESLWEEIENLYNKKYSDIWAQKDFEDLLEFDWVDIVDDEGKDEESEGDDIVDDEGKDEESEGDDAVIPIENLIKVTSYNKSNKSCFLCRRKPKHRFHGGEVDLVYCNSHWNLCNMRGCRKASNHMSETGLRYCHEHARGKEKIRADSLIKSMGYIMEKVSL